MVSSMMTVTLNHVILSQGHDDVKSIWNETFSYRVRMMIAVILDACGLFQDQDHQIHYFAF